MKLIPVGKKIRKFAMVDDEDFEELNKYKWSLGGGKPNRRYVERTEYKNGKKCNIYMHRQILGLKKTEHWCDHKNGNTLDNRRENIRKCTPSQNRANTKMPSNNTTGARGVSFFKNLLQKPWRSRIDINHKRLELGYFKTKEEAAKQYNKFAKEYFGEFARLNTMV
jgi:hypothetical protein